ncbi:hypothetical protein GEMRC1_000842 [Eukaryota sp. GEM-RC1]
MQYFQPLITSVNLSHNSISLNVLLTIFERILIFTGKLTTNIKVLPHIIDVSLSTIHYEIDVDSFDLSSLLNNLILEVPISIKHVKCHVHKCLFLEELMLLCQIISINNTVLDLDISPHFIDIENGVFCFSPGQATQLTSEEISSLIGFVYRFGIKELLLKRIRLCDSTLSAFCNIFIVPTLTFIDFSHCELSEDHVSALISARQLSSGLSKISLRIDEFPQL